MVLRHQTRHYHGEADVVYYTGKASRHGICYTGEASQLMVLRHQT